MKKFLLLTFFLSIIFGYTVQQKKQKIIFFGDSITQAGVNATGYITKMTEIIKERGLTDRYELIGKGIGGNKVYDLFLRMDEDVIAQSPDIVVIWVGVNDVWHKRTFGTGTDPDKFEKFYTAIIKKLQAKNVKVFLCTPAAIGEKTDFSNELDGDLNEYANIIRKVATANNCGLIDLRKVFLQYNLANNQENKGSGVLTTDRVHLNEKGNNLVAAEMVQALIR
ncbi:MAG TPA: GDSL-type esterase/lipase family protein [Flavitalea sp.]|nr:GDSL-type esterase/lipase family protein [Flavitalea sp.]